MLRILLLLHLREHRRTAQKAHNLRWLCTPAPPRGRRRAASWSTPPRETRPDSRLCCVRSASRLCCVVAFSPLRRARGAPRSRRRLSACTSSDGVQSLSQGTAAHRPGLAPAAHRALPPPILSAIPCHHPRHNARWADVVDCRSFHFSLFAFHFWKQLVES